MCVGILTFAFICFLWVFHIMHWKLRRSHSCVPACCGIKSSCSLTCQGQGDARKTCLFSHLPFLLLQPPSISPSIPGFYYLFHPVHTCLLCRLGSSSRACLAVFPAKCRPNVTALASVTLIRHTRTPIPSSISLNLILPLSALLKSRIPSGWGVGSSYVLTHLRSYFTYITCALLIYKNSECQN